jgi:hypothetical protein
MSDTKKPKRDKKKIQPEESKNDEKELDDILEQIHERKGGEEVQPAPKKEEPEDIIRPPKKEEKTTEEGEEGVEEILEKISEKQEEEPTEKLNVIQRIIGIFTGPVKVFEYLRLRPDYLTPIILAIILAIFSAVLVYDIAIDDQIIKIEENDKIPQERKETIIDRLESSKQGPQKIVSITVFPILGVIIIYALISAVFLFIGNVLLGGKARFKQIFSAYGYSFLIASILGTIVKLPLMLSQQTTQIHVSPAVFLDSSAEGSALFRFMSSLDIFEIWSLIVFGIGFAIIYRFSQLKGVVSVIIAWLVYVVIFKVILGGLLIGLTG